MLILNVASIANCKWGKRFGMDITILSGTVEALSKSLFFLIPSISPNRADVLIAELFQTVNETKSVPDWRPKTISAGEMLQSGSGVFLSCIIARRKRSLLRIPDGEVFERSRRLVALTDTSARQLDCGLCADDKR